MQNLKADNPASEDVRAPGLSPLNGDLQQTRLFDSPKSYRYRVYNGGLTWDLGGLSLISSTSYSTFRLSRSEDIPAYDAAFAPLGIAFHLLQPISDDKFSQELRLQSPASDTLEWRVGAFFTSERSDPEPAHRRTSASELHAGGRAGRHPAARTASPKPPVSRKNLTYHPTPQFDLTVGGRYSHNSQHSHEAGVLSGAPVDAPLSTSDSSGTWLINPRYKLDEHTMIYARAASAYRPGGPTTQVPGFVGPNSFDPDRLTDYEMGLKGAYLEHRLTLDVAAFYIDWQKIQLNESVNGFTYITNGGKAHSQGVEASATLTPLPGLNFTATTTYTDAALDPRNRTGEHEPNTDGDQLPGAIRATGRWSLDSLWVDASSQTGAPSPGAATLVGGAIRPSWFVRWKASRDRRSACRATSALDVVDLRIGVSRNAWTLTAYVKSNRDEPWHLNSDRRP